MKTNTLYAICTVAVLSAFAQRAAAYELNLAATPEDTHVVSSSVGLENAFVATVGYGHTLRLLDRVVLVGGNVTLPWATPDSGDFRLKVGGLVPVVTGAQWRLLAQVMPVLRGSESLLNRMTNFGVEAGVVGGYYGRRWFAAAELGGDWAMLTHVEHSARYRSTTYAGAKDGWYRTTGATVHAGFFGGYSLDTVDLVLRAGQQRDLHLDKLLVPAYLTLGVNVRLPS